MSSRMGRGRPGCATASTRRHSHLRTKANKPRATRTTKPRPQGTGFFLRKAIGALRLCLGDLAALDAAGAHADALGCAVNQRFDRLQVHVPAPAGYVVRVRDVVAELRPLAAYIACLCHDLSSTILSDAGAGRARKGCADAHVPSACRMSSIAEIRFQG